ncbi:hypothetical protein [Roseimicrobium sp. ORNL1]|uniref:hypothetical protein n=1 Tax=Roseimicrobium sp. ORNL1 TaxID=2711231 RepID=UPI0013E1079F|nr:hypothetical protein [Roseimicrobium sp. ORNL1]QIF00982.1 hypothetical protein G5S37_05440 [Roseimicrobium sp. ORNL1]
MKLPKTLEIPHVPFPTAEQMAGNAQETSPAKTEFSLEFIKRQEEMMKSWIHITNQIWRLGTVVLDSDSGEAKTEFSSQDIRKVANSLHTIQETIGSLGIRVIDRRNQEFDAGLPEQVVTEEAQEGITKERVIRTIRPTIMWHQTMVQRGEIDIAVPASKKEQ